jgi:lauroyl/myristoyl acyltransferase
MTGVDDVRRAATRIAVRGGLRLAGRLGVERTRALGNAIGRSAALVPPLRRRLEDNLRAAGMDHSHETIRAYFRRFGFWVGHGLNVYAHGIERSGLTDQVELDPDTVRHLDEAVARGKGVILASPHLFLHEMGAGLIHRRHPVTAIVRDSKDPVWARMKVHWYNTALGVETLSRPRRSSMAEEIITILRALRTGRVLGITPDVLASRRTGVPVRLFGRTVLLSPGIILLAMRSGASLVTGEVCWYRDSSAPSGERVRMLFTEPQQLPKTSDRETALRDGLQQWCVAFEAQLRRSPADWLFWLDKGWTRVLRRPAESGGGA